MFVLIGTSRQLFSRPSKWFMRHSTDQYVKEAQAAGLRSRAAFKLAQIQQKYNIIPKRIRQQQLTHLQLSKPSLQAKKAVSIKDHTQKHQNHNLNVLELGCSPGSWTQMALKIEPDLKIVGVDLLEDYVRTISNTQNLWHFIVNFDSQPSNQTSPIPNAIFLQGDFMSHQIQSALRIRAPFRLVMSDAAPNFTGNLFETHQESCEMNLQSIRIALEQADQGSHLILKAIEGPILKGLLLFLTQCYQFVDRFKPKASRGESVEMYVIARSKTAKLCPEQIPSQAKQIDARQIERIDSRSKARQLFKRMQLKKY